MARSEPIPILFTHYGDQWIRGSERVLLDLLTRLDPARVRPILWCNAAEMEEAARAAGLTTHRSAFAYYFCYGSPRFDPVRYAGFVREGLHLAHRYGIRLLHANSAAPTQWLLPLARLRRIPLLTHLHGSYLRHDRYALLLHQASLVVGVTTWVLEGLRADGMDAGRLQVIHNGIDFARFHDSPPSENLRARIGLAADSLLIGTVGSLIPRKGHDVLLRAMRRLGETRSVHLAIAGDGPERVALEQLAATLGIRERVHFLGYCADPSPLYRASDIVALASRSEALPLVPLEAGYFARAVVATRVGGTAEAVADCSTGLLVPPEDPDALSAALGRLIADPGYRQSLGQAARERVATSFSVGRMVGAFTAAYEALCSPVPDPGTWVRRGWADLRPYRRLLMPVARR